jgi:hypothetical protein
MMLLWWREPTWENSEPYKSGGPHIRSKGVLQSFYVAVVVVVIIILSM